MLSISPKRFVTWPAGELKSNHKMFHSKVEIFNSYLYMTSLDSNDVIKIKLKKWLKISKLLLVLSL